MVFWKNRKSASPFQSFFRRIRTDSNDSKCDRSPRRSIWFRSRWGCLIAATVLGSGCMSSNDELFFYGEPREIQQYVDQATKIDYSTYDQQSPQSVAASQPPRRIRHPRKDEIRDLTLSEALQTALGNAEIIRDNAQFLSTSNRLLAAPDVVSSIYDIAIQESNVLFGQGGVAAALADFDAVLSTQMNWGKNESPSESGTIGFGALDSQQEEFGRFNASIQKPFAHGGLVSLEHNINYSEVNQRTDLGSSRPFNSQFSGNPGVGMSYRLPLAQGAGAEYTRIAGTIVRRPTLQGIPTVNQGVVIARIRSDIALADFESSINNLVKDVEDAYWDLYLAYRRYDAEMLSKESALRTWRQVRVNEQAERVGLSDEAQARDNYYEIRARSEDALAVLYNAELRLRRLMGLSVNDGEVIRPATEPMTAEVSLDWNSTLAEALVHRPELRKQKWNIKSLELQHRAAEKLVRPRLDFVASYAVNAFGDQLTGDGPNYHSAYATLLSGKHTNWGLGFEFSMPFGFRGAITQVQNYEHRLSKARAILAQQELEISHELANAFQQIDQAYQTARTNFNRRRAAERRVQAFEAEYKVQRTTLDLVLRAQISLAAAETAYYSSLVNYNRALNDLKFRKGTILTENSVFLTEGVWHEDAYDDALRRAWERSFAFDVSGWMDETEPEEFVFGCPTCHSSDPGTEPIPEDIELPYEDPAPPLERETVPPAPHNDRSARLENEGVPGGLGTGRLPYDETVIPLAPGEVPANSLTDERGLPVQEEFLPGRAASGEIIPQSGEFESGPGRASLIETQPDFLPADDPLKQVGLEESPADTAAEDPTLFDDALPAESHVPADPSGQNQAETSGDELYPIPVPGDGGLTGGLDHSELSDEPFSASMIPTQPQEKPVSREQLLRTSPHPVQKDADNDFPLPVFMDDDEDGFAAPVRQSSFPETPASAASIEAGIQPADGVASPGRTAPPQAAPHEPAEKKSRFPRLKSFYKWGQK